MIFIAFIIGLVLGFIIASMFYSNELKVLEKRKGELSAMYYKEVERLTTKLEKLEKELLTYKR